MLIIALPTNTYRPVLVNSFKMGARGTKRKGKYVHSMQNYVCLLKQVEEEGVCVEHTHDVSAAHILTYC